VAAVHHPKAVYQDKVNILFSVSEGVCLSEEMACRQTTAFRMAWLTAA
jgi:hypothetical protein